MRGAADSGTSFKRLRLDRHAAIAAALGSVIYQAYR